MYRAGDSYIKQGRNVVPVVFDINVSYYIKIGYSIFVKIKKQQTAKIFQRR